MKNYKLVSDLTGRTKENPIPERDFNKELANNFRYKRDVANRPIILRTQSSPFFFSNGLMTVVFLPETNSTLKETVDEFAGKRQEDV